MAEEKKSLPKFPANKWWQLRRQFKKSFPSGSLSTNYLSTVLSIAESSVPPYIAPLRTLGLLDENAKPTDRANDWRNDEKYAAACAAMLQEVYPSELRELEPGPTVDKGKVADWISGHLKIGQEAARQMSALYAMLVEADPARADADSGPGKQSSSETLRTKSKSKSTAKNSKGTADTSNDAVAPEAPPPPTPLFPPAVGITPTVHLDVQIHISPDATNDQIEKIFESMGKHVFNRGSSS